MKHILDHDFLPFAVFHFKSSVNKVRVHLTALKGGQFFTYTIQKNILEKLVFKATQSKF